MELVVLLACVMLIGLTVSFGILMALMDSEFYASRIKTNLSKDNQKYIKSLDSKRDEIILTLAKNTDYSVYVYVKLGEKYIDFSYDKIRIYSHPESTTVDKVKEVINYLYTVTGQQFTVVDKTKDTVALTDTINTLNVTPLKRIEREPDTFEQNL